MVVACKSEDENAEDDSILFEAGAGEPQEIKILPQSANDAASNRRGRGGEGGGGGGGKCPTEPAPPSQQKTSADTTTITRNP